MTVVMMTGMSVIIIMLAFALKLLTIILQLQRQIRSLGTESLAIGTASNTQAMQTAVAVLDRLDIMLKNMPEAATALSMARVTDAPYESTAPHYAVEDHPNRLFTPRRTWSSKKKT